MSPPACYEDPPALDFNDLHLHGRDNEIEALNKAYKRASRSSRPQTVWLKGDPGVGKSALVEHLFLQKDYYCFGKFEQLRTSIPFSALVQLLTALCYTLEYEDITISSLSSADKETISSLVPEVSTILTTAASSASSVAAASRDTNDTLDDSDAGASSSSEDDYASDSSSTGCNDEWRMERLKQALKSFLRAVCDELKFPIIMFLDDLQWADLDSLEVVKDFLVAEDNDAGGGDASASSSSNKKEKKKKKKHSGNGILFIGAYRDNEVQERCHPLAQCITDVSEHLNHHQEQHRVSELQISSLDLSGTTMLVAELTNSREDAVVELSELVHSKTNGNCFYTLHILRHICEKNFLYMSKWTHKWEWNAESIREEVQVSDNIAEFLSRKLDDLPPSTQRALTFAAFFGTKVDMTLLESFVVWKYPQLPPLLELLQPAVESNLIKLNDCSHTNVKTIHFTHDRLTSAAYDMIPKEGQQQELVHLEIGWYMHGLVLSDDDRDVGSFNDSFTSISDAKDWRMVHAVNHLNKGADLLDNRQQRVLAANMNLAAAQQMSQTGAFELALGFLEKGLQLLGVHRWQATYELTLKLSDKLASVLYSNGSIEKCKDLLMEIIGNASCDADRYEALSIQLEVLESAGEIEACLKVGLDTLEAMGHPKIPRAPKMVHLIAGVVTAKRSLKRMTDEKLLSLPICTDPKIEFIMRHLNCLAGIAYFSCREELMAIIGYRILQMTLKHGATRYSAYSFCVHSGSLGSMGEISEAFRFAQLAVRLLNRFKKTEYRTATFAYCIMFHLRTPIHECVNKSLQLYNAAFNQGDVRSASTACMAHCSHRFTAGMPLESIAKDSVAFIKQLVKFGHGQSLMVRYSLLNLRVALELLDRPEDMLQFLDHLMDDREFELYLESGGDKNGGKFFCCQTMGSRFIMCDTDSALQLGSKWWYKTDHSAFFAFTPTNLLFKALTALLVWKRNKRRRYWSVFTQSHKKLASWVEKGNLNSSHMVLLLDAELAVVKQKNAEKIKDIFHASINEAKRSGFLKDAALANERAGRYFVDCKDVHWAEYHLRNAHALYADWDAVAKVRQLEKEFSGLKLTTRRRQSNVSLTGRSRCDDIAQAEAKREGSGVLPTARLSSGSIEFRKSNDSIDTSRRLSSDSIDTRKSNGSIDTRKSNGSIDTRKSNGSIHIAGHGK